MNMPELQNKSIKVFACDHRKIDQWNLPYIRIGTGYNNNAAIKDIVEDNITKDYDKLFSEGTAMWWLWKHISEFGNADYVGFCHYRRFFTVLKPNYGVFPIFVSSSKNMTLLLQYILTPELLLSIITQHNADGIMPIAFPDYGYYEKCKNIKEVMFEESNRPDILLNMPKDLCNMAFEILLNNTPTYLKDNMQKTYTDLNGYHFNLFVLRRQLFEEYNNIVWKSCFEIERYAKEKHYDTLHSRWIAYLLERYTSCIIKSFELNGSKLILLPMMMLELEKYI